MNLLGQFVMAVSEKVKLGGFLSVEEIKKI